MQGKKSGKVGRPGIGKDLRELIIRIARDNAQWGYRRIVGELRKLALSVSSSTVRRMLKDEGIYPEPSKGRSRTGDGSWRRFIRLHMDTLIACDFFTKKITTPWGFRTAYCLFFIHLGSRKVFLTSATYHANDKWVLQQAHAVNKWCRQQDFHAEYLIRDRDGKFTHQFDKLFTDRGTEVIQTPVRAPNANAFAESWVATVKRECLNYFVCFSLGHLDHIAQEFLRFYNRDRPHQGIGNRPLDLHRQLPSDTELTKPICCREYLGGLLRVYGRTA